MISCHPDAVWTNNDAVSTWSAGASSISRQKQWQTDSNFWQYNLLTTHLTLQSFLFCSFLVIYVSHLLFAALKTRAAYCFPHHATGPENDTVKQD